jgi:hypothetical protein
MAVDDVMVLAGMSVTAAITTATVRAEKSATCATAGVVSPEAITTVHDVAAANAAVALRVMVANRVPC